MSHKRIIPRDFFNEAKLLNCLGHLQLLIENNAFKGMEVEFDHEPFRILQDDSDGSLYVSNYNLKINGQDVHLFIPYNTKDKFPLMARWHNEDYYVFSEDGKTMPAFFERNS
jgi:hypothetical protein